MRFINNVNKILFIKLFADPLGLSTPSKYGYGLASLWRGCSLRIFLEILYKMLFFKKKIKEDKQNEFLFSSARCAIAVVLNAFFIGKKDEVIICSFTCDAVTKAILSTKATPVYVDINDDLTMNEKAVKRSINNKTKAILVQNTFGRLGLSEQFINKCKEKNILMIEDNCLSIGSKYNNQPLGNLCPFSIWSLEASKSITIGWGGVLQINDKTFYAHINKYIQGIERISIIEDFKRLFQLLISLFFSKFPSPFGFLFWYFFYGLRIFRRSSDENKILNKKEKLMGIISSNFYNYLKPKFNDFYLKANWNYNYVNRFAKNLGINSVIDNCHNEFIVSPRLSFYADPKKHNQIFALSKKFNI